ncbi:hypothetical protein HNY73_021233 [Argiope bruennichi]|uniref:Uncharacterized protein n=1 Tax=Argiope bruennichi TaxID=94029 RepID=A0A8T0EAP1_ARGBR|nr:hypothetical protein HNY73_021233 [Argiope bruennichi]
MFDSDAEFARLRRKANCPACGRSTLISFGKGHCLECHAPLPKSTTTTASNSRSSTPILTRQVPIESRRSPQPSPQIPNSEINMVSPISQKQKNSQDNFQPVPSKKAAKKPRTEENFKFSTENAFSHLQEETDKTSKTPATISLVIKENYNLILQEIMKNHPETENNFQNGYIQIKPKSENARQEIIQLLQTKKQDFIMNEAPEERPVKIVISTPKTSKKSLNPTTIKS